MHTEPQQGEAGFTLLEVMVAFVIAALASIALYRAGFNGVADGAAAARYQDAVVRAESRLASVGTLTPLRPQEVHGDDGGGFRWRLSIRKLRHSGTVTLYAVRVTETFGDRRVTLATERVGTETRPESP